MLQRCGKQALLFLVLQILIFQVWGCCFLFFFSVVGFCLFVLVWFWFCFYSLTREVQSNVVRKLDANVKESAEPVEFFYVLSP